MVNRVTVKSILNKKKRRDPWFLDDYTLNPYNACSFNCLYCYIRGSKYGVHMEQKLAVKENALELLEKQLALRAKKGQFGIIVLASATDPYLQVEKDEGLTRKMLEIIFKYRFPLHVITKSDLVVRDFDLLKQIDQRAFLPADLKTNLNHRVFMTFSFSTLDNGIGKIFEPGATPPSARLKALANAVQNGFHAGVSMMPLLPYISDTDDSLRLMFQNFSTAGARYVFPASLTLFGNGPADSRTLMFDAIAKHYPALLASYQKLFGDNIQASYHYRNALEKNINVLRIQYGISNSILNT